MFFSSGGELHTDLRGGAAAGGGTGDLDEPTDRQHQVMKLQDLLARTAWLMVLPPGGDAGQRFGSPQRAASSPCRSV